MQLAPSEKWGVVKGDMNVHSFSVAVVNDKLQSGPSRATAGPGKTLSRGPITPILYVLRSRDDTWGEVSPHHPTKGSGERRKLPQRGLGGRKLILCIF